MKIPSLKTLKKGDWPARKQAAIKKLIPHIVFRQDWDALPAKEEMLWIPVPNVIFTYTGTEECFSEEECIKTLQIIQKRDMEERGLVDIQYNFYIGNEGGMYEGRGWHMNSTREPQFEHLDGKSIDIAYMGDFKDRQPDLKMIKGAKKLLDHLWGHCYLTETYNMIPLGRTEPVEMVGCKASKILLKGVK